MSPEQSRDPMSLSQAAKLLQIPARYFLHVWFHHQVVGKETSVHEPEQQKENMFLEVRSSVKGQGKGCQEPSHHE